MVRIWGKFDVYVISNSRVFKFEMLPKKEKYDFWLDFRAFLAHNSPKWGEVGLKC